MEKLNLQNSIRLSMFLKILPHIRDLKCKVPQFYILDYTEMPTEFFNDTVNEWANTIKGKVLEGTGHFTNEHIFAHPCPVDEYYYQNLSFAGVYDSYKPFRDESKERNIIDGIVKVIAGRYTEYSNYYYSRHNINGDRRVGIMFTPSVDKCCMFGTAYVYNDRCLFDYYDSPLSIYQNDPKRIAATSLSKLHGYEDTILKSVFDIQSIIGKPLDIEFIITRDEELIINEIRPISKVHLNNWGMLDEVVWKSKLNIQPPSNVLNTVGTVKGSCIDLRSRRPEDSDFYNTSEKVYIINHVKNINGTSSLEFLKYINDYNVKDINLIVDHGKTRRNNHLQYVIFEDPGISFVVNLTNLKLELDKEVCIKSDGFNVLINNDRY